MTILARQNIFPQRINKHLIQHLLKLTTPTAVWCGLRLTIFTCQRLKTRFTSMEQFRPMMCKTIMVTSTLRQQWLRYRLFLNISKTYLLRVLTTPRFTVLIYTSEESPGPLLSTTGFQFTSTIIELSHTSWMFSGITCGLLFYTRQCRKHMAVIKT